MALAPEARGAITGSRRTRRGKSTIQMKKRDKPAPASSTWALDLRE